MLLEGLPSTIFVGGKGGVGKTTIAACLALAAARRGERACLVSTDPAHNLGHLFGRSIGPGPVELEPGLGACELDPEEMISAHLAETAVFLKDMMPREAHGEIDRHLERSRLAPGMAEAALLDRLSTLTDGIDRAGGRLIVDTAPTGHTLSLLSLPELMAAWTDGLLKNRSEADGFAARARQLAGGAPEPDRNARIRGVLNRRRLRLGQLRDRLVDPGRAAFLIATIAERMPVEETRTLAASLDRAGIEVPGIVVNRVGRRSADELKGRLAPLMADRPGTPIWTLPETPSEPEGAEDLAALHRSLARYA